MTSTSRTIATLLFAFAAILAAAFAATATDADQPQHTLPEQVRITGDALTFTDGMAENGFANSVRGIVPATTDLGALYDDTCTFYASGFGYDSVAGFLDRQRDLTHRQARAAALAGVEFCPGNGGAADQWAGSTA